MSVEKFKSNKIIGETVPYTQVNTKVIQNINDLSVLGIWVYLLSLPPDWKVVKEHVRKHFNVGEKKLKKIFAYLVSCNLVEYVQERNNDGTMGSFDILIKNGSKFNVPTARSKTALAVNRPSGEEGTTNKIDNKRYKKNKENISTEEISLPIWLSPKDWRDYLYHRQFLKSPLSKIAEKRALNALSKLKDQGFDPSEVINQTIINNWKGLFPIGKGNNNRENSVSRAFRKFSEGIARPKGSKQTVNDSDSIELGKDAFHEIH